MKIPMGILRCPISGQSLKQATPSQLHDAILRQRAGNLLTRAGEIAEVFEDAIVTEDEAWLYPIRNRIPVVMASEAIANAVHS